MKWQTAGEIVVVAGLLGYMAATSPYRPIFNDTPSIPEGFYLLKVKPANVRELYAPGTLLAFRYHSPLWAINRYGHDESLFLKHVGAAPGMWLETRNRVQYACAPDYMTPSEAGFKKYCQPMGRALEHDSKGRQMQYMTWNHVRVPIGQYYMMATDVPNSYDSRYFGLVPEDRIVGSLTPLWTWK